MRCLKLAIPALILTTSTIAEAKPISYVDGIMVMQENDETGHTITADYTITPNYAIGWYSKEEENGKRFSEHGPEFNSLIKRWNLPDGQVNIFNSTGAGVAIDGSRNRGMAWTDFLADYETRRIFTSYEIKAMYADSIESSIWQRARVGFAPYAANYNDVATWFMLQVDDHPNKNDKVVVTPIVRFFYKTSLLEAGYSSANTLMFNWELQF